MLNSISVFFEVNLCQVVNVLILALEFMIGIESKPPLISAISLG